MLENISNYLDSLLQPHVCIKDTGDFIQKIEGRYIPEDSLLLSLDVVSLYTNMPHEELKNVIREYLESDHNLPPVHFILDLVDLLFEKDYFRFKSDYLLQVKSISMGSFSPLCVANLLW